MKICGQIAPQILYTCVCVCMCTRVQKRATERMCPPDIDITGAYCLW